MILKRNHFVLMSALGAMMSAGAAAAHAIEDGVKEAIGYIEGKLHLIHAVTGQVNHFDDQGQVDTFLANVADPDSWVAPQPMSLAQIVGTADVTQVDSTADQVASLAPVTTVNLDLDQLRAGAAPADAITIDTAAAAASDVAVDPAAANEAAPAVAEQTAETPAA